MARIFTIVRRVCTIFAFDGALLYNDRVIIPPSLRHSILSTLHSAHQGISGMHRNTQDSVFWPGITVDIEAVRRACRFCDKIAPSQAKLPPVEPLIPTTPFESIVADYFEFESFYYLVIADRLTGWPEVYRIKVGTEEAGARGLLSLLKRYFGKCAAKKQGDNMLLKLKLINELVNVFCGKNWIWMQ